MHDRFTLGPWTWEVIKICEDEFCSGSLDDSDDVIWLQKSKSDSLSWIKPKVTISKEAFDMLDHFTREDSSNYVWKNELREKLRSMIEEG